MDEFWSCRRLLDEIEIGREIKKAEARAILLKAEQDGWVHLPPAQADDKIYIGIAPR